MIHPSKKYFITLNDLETYWDLEHLHLFCKYLTSKSIIVNESLKKFYDVSKNQWVENEKLREEIKQFYHTYQPNLNNASLQQLSWLRSIDVPTNENIFLHLNEKEVDYSKKFLLMFHQNIIKHNPILFDDYKKLIKQTTKDYAKLYKNYTFIFEDKQYIAFYLKNNYNIPPKFVNYKYNYNEIEY